MLFNNRLSWELRLFFHSLIFPAILAFLMFTVKLVEHTEGISMAEWGINPRHIDTLSGIILAPFIHGDWAHLVGNLPSLFVLMVLLNYFYRGLAFRTVILTWLFTGVFVWLAGRESYHIGSSGIIYGLATFLLFSGIIRNHIPLMAITLVVVFLYGSLIWGIFPFHFNLPYSWESHLGGTIIGLALAIFYRNKGPQRTEKVWEEEPDDDPYWKVGEEDVRKYQS